MKRADEAARVYMFRKRDPEERELIGEFVFSDMARLCAVTVCQQYGYTTEVHYADESFKTDRYEWGMVEHQGVRAVREFGDETGREVRIGTYHDRRLDTA